jgi:hypothetical protein
MLLKDLTRRKIIELMAEQGKIGSKELRSGLGLGVGTVYYHLDMLSDFISQDKNRKYSLNDRGQLLYRSLKDGSVLPALGVGNKTLSHRFGSWLFLSPVFAKSVRLEVFLPLAVAILALGAVGSSLAKLEPVFFFYFSSTRPFGVQIILFFFYWIILFFITDALTYALFRRVGGDLQLFACIGVAALPLTVFPYVHMVIPVALSWLSRCLLFVLQVWTVILLSSALTFGKGLRLERSIIISLMILYLNVALLILLGLMP